MFDISMSEILVIAVVACLFLDPKKVKAVMRDARHYYQRFMKVKHDIVQLINEDLDTYHVVGQDGKKYLAYETSDMPGLENLAAEKKYDSKSTDSR